MTRTIAAFLLALAAPAGAECYPAEIVAAWDDAQPKIEVENSDIVPESTRLRRAAARAEAREREQERLRAAIEGCRRLAEALRDPAALASPSPARDGARP